jgi:MraZ protein
MGTEAVQDASYEDLAYGFTGSFPVKLDSALRLPLPAKFREVLEKRYGSTSTLLFVIPDQGKLRVLPKPVFDRFQEELSRAPWTEQDGDDIRSFIYGNMARQQLDPQNRIRLTQDLCDLGEITKEVVVAGNSDGMEIWDADAWKAQNAATAKAYKQKAAEVFRRLRAGGSAA